MDEDLILRILFEDYCNQLGAEYIIEAELLNNDPTFEFQEYLDQKCRDIIDRELGISNDYQ